jgi:mannose-6-phosphate isomerase-like protein (cupin superfamily)
VQAPRHPHGIHHAIAMKLPSTAVGFVLSSTLLATLAGAQTPPPPTQQPKPPAQPAQAPRPRPKPQSIQVTVRDQSGTPISFVHVTVSGTVSRTILTNADGAATLQALPDGTYRVRFEHDNFVTLERDLTVRSGQPHDFEVQMTAAAETTPPPAPEPPRAAPTPAAPPPPPPSGPPVTLSIPAYLDKNFIGGRDPLKESVLGCMGAATTRLLQLREPVAVHTHEQDEIIYVIAGDGAVRIRPSNGTAPGVAAGADAHEETNVVAAGSLSIVPRGVPHAIERRGRNPLIVLSTLAGAPCQSATTTQASKQ